MRRIFSGTSFAVSAFAAATAVPAASLRSPAGPNHFHSLIGAVASNMAATGYAVRKLNLRIGANVHAVAGARSGARVQVRE